MGTFDVESTGPGLLFLLDMQGEPVEGAVELQWQDLEADAGLFGHLDHVPRLLVHHLRTADVPAQIGLIDDHSEIEGVSSGGALLADEADLDVVAQLFWGSPTAAGVKSARM